MAGQTVEEGNVRTERSSLIQEIKWLGYWITTEFLLKLDYNDSYFEDRKFKIGVKRVIPKYSIVPYQFSGFELNSSYRYWKHDLLLAEITFKLYKCLGKVERKREEFAKIENKT